MEHRSTTFLERTVTEDSQRDQQDASTTLQSRFLNLEGEKSSFQYGTVYSPRPPYKRPRWMDLDSENTVHSSIPGVPFHKQVTNERNFASHSSSLRFQPQIYSPTSLNGHAPHAVSSGCLAQTPSSGAQQIPASNNHVTTGISLVLPKLEGNLKTTQSNNSERFPGNNGNVTEEQSITSEHLPSSVVNVTEILAELERERKKNVELLGKVAMLEARLEEKGRGIGGGGDQTALVGFQHTILNCSKKPKGQGKIEKTGDSEAAEDSKQCFREVEVKQEQGVQTVGTDFREICNVQESVVTWMGREDVLPPDSDRAVIKGADSERDESLYSDDSDDEDDDSSTDDDEEDDEEEEEETQTKSAGRRKAKRHSEGGINSGTQFIGSDDGVKNSDGKILEIKEHNGSILSCRVSNGVSYEDKDIEDKRFKNKKKREREGNKSKLPESIRHGKKGSSYEMLYRAPGMVASYKKAPKTAFCPKEVKRIMESGVLALKNAQSHTMRKIIVFASLCIRHGCEDLYELDFSHFSIMRPGEPYVSPKDPGEHVLYEHPGVRRRIFYPNRQNPILCPVRILDEERAMRPSGPSCPSCLFLCIKYGGRTRNLPQNEYVRQRMGRNKLKSFGPLMCQMALLVHIRTGSFFFKALGITLLFMAGFPADLVRKETKYRNLDLLQKYYRSDADSKVDHLFHPYPPFYAQALLATTATSAKNSTAGSKSAGKKPPPPLLSRPSGSQTGAPLYLQPITARPLSTAPFGGPGFPSVPSPVVSPLPPPRPLPPITTISSSGGSITSMCAGTSGPTTSISSGPLPHLPPPHYAMFPPYAIQRPPVGGFPPLPVWPPVNSFPPSPFTSHLYGYQAFSHATQYGSSSPAYYGNPFFPFPPPVVKRESEKNENDLMESDCDSDSSSSGEDQKSEKENSSDSKAA